MNKRAREAQAEQQRRDAVRRTQQYLSDRVVFEELLFTTGLDWKLNEHIFNTSSTPASVTLLGGDPPRIQKPVALRYLNLQDYGDGTAIVCYITDEPQESGYAIKLGDEGFMLYATGALMEFLNQEEINGIVKQINDLRFTADRTIHGL